MKYGIISDIHSNLQAIEEVMDWLINKEKIDRFICLGDIVGYGAQPNACITVIRLLKKCMIIGGNHEWAVRGLENMDFYNPIARESLEWTARQLTDDNMKWLDCLKKFYRRKNFMIVHGSPRDPIREYVSDKTVFRVNLPLINPNICFIGHTHISEYYYDNSSGRISVKLLADNDKVEIKSSCRYLINCGSVGQPRGGRDNMASFGIYDDENKTIRIKKLPYDIKKAQKEILEAGLPEFLARRLELGC